MKIFYLMFIALCTFQWAGAQNINIPDTNFKQALIDLGIDGGDGEISVIEAAAVTSLNVSLKSISNLTGIEHFTSLEYLGCDNNDLTSLDVSGLTSLKILICYSNSLTSLDVNGLTSLETLSCSFNALTSIDMSELTSLESLVCNNTDLTRLDVSGLTSLEYLSCFSNSLTRLDVNGLTSLVELYCDNNSLTSLDVSGLTSLENLTCSYNALTSLDIRNTPALSYLVAFYNPNLECIVVDNVNNVPSEVYTDFTPPPYSTEPCLILDFDDLADVIDGEGISPYLAALLTSTTRVAEEACSQGNKSTAIFTLKSLKLMVRRSRQIGRMTAFQTSKLIKSINMLIGNIRSGAVDCNGGHRKNILDWINDWFGWNSLEEPEQAGTLDNYIPSSSTVQNVYPNPTSGRVNFAQPDQQVVVYNMLGKVMERAEGADHVDLSTYQPGVYVIQLIKGEEWSVHQVVRR